MTTILEVTRFIEAMAPPSLQESYDNSGFMTGSADVPCSGVVVSLDVTEAVVKEAAACGANLVVAHHPLIFKGLKRLDPDDPVGRTLIAAIRRDVAVFAAHTNLDNVLPGVNSALADRLGLSGRRVLRPMEGRLRKLHCYVPEAHLETVRNALFEAGAGHIGRYSGCSFFSPGTGTFTAGEGAMPFVGELGMPHEEAEQKLEVVFPAYLEARVIGALRAAHPYEEVAYDVMRIENKLDTVGAGLVGDLSSEMDERDFLDLVKSVCRTPFLRHSAPTGRSVGRVALCGGAGGFLLPDALRSGADAFLTADLKYHDFFEPDGRLLMVDMGHGEGESFMVDLVCEALKEKFPTFAVRKSAERTNPVHYH
jgi:dinuclear metal center YbgI/SA1388 family protein